MSLKGAVSIRSITLHAVVTDVAASLGQAGITKPVIVNGHGGNYVLSNVVQESNVNERRMVLFPRSEDWADARRSAGLMRGNHEDMHGGEAETSILLATAPEVVRPATGMQTSPQTSAATPLRQVCMLTQHQV